MKLSRRLFIQSSAAAAFASWGSRAGCEPRDAAQGRAFHLSISPDALAADPDLLKTVAQAGVKTLWITGFLYGYWHYPLPTLLDWQRRAESEGVETAVIDVPLGHPGDALGAKSGTLPLTPPGHWHLATRPDGSTYAGTSLHAPATEENQAALSRLREAGFQRVFVDDDFRLAQGPGVIGGCFCDEHRRAFLHRTGYPESRWAELLQAVGQRQLTPVLRDWVNFQCDELTACFRAQQAALAPGELGNMVMYLGAEKAGIRLADYADVPLRVGELMFNDASFAPIQGKTNELFSCLFHRRFVTPERAFSETTAYPADQLSAPNMAAKLAVSTLADVRNTMFMSGITAFPRTHWDTLAPAMRRHAAIHSRIAGHAPRGPLKHYWGEASRYVGDDNPYSLFLALGIPFEVTDRPAADGFTFLSDADAQSVAAGALHSAGTRWMARAAAGSDVQILPETLEALWAWKAQWARDPGEVPFLEGQQPAVFAWYPTARAGLVWNLQETRQEFTVRWAGRRTVTVDGLDVALVDLAGV